jgi:hypothetical protein
MEIGVALDMDQEHLLTCLIKDVKIMIYAIKIKAIINVHVTKHS